MENNRFCPNLEEDSSRVNIKFSYAGDSTGECLMTVDESGKKIFWDEFYPRNEYRGTRKGIGTLAHIATLEFLKEIIGPEISSHHVIHDLILINLLVPGQIPDREAHLEAIGVRSGLPFDKYLRISSEFLQRRGYF